MDALLSAPGACSYGLVSSTLAETLGSTVPEWLRPELARLPTTRVFVPLPIGTGGGAADSPDAAPPPSVAVVGRADVESVAVDSMAVSRRLLQFSPKPSDSAEVGPGLLVRVVAKSSVVTLERRLRDKRTGRVEMIDLGGPDVVAGAAADEGAARIAAEVVALPGDRFVIPGGVRLTLFVMGSTSPPPPLQPSVAAASNEAPTPARVFVAQQVQTDPVADPLPAPPPQRPTTAEAATSTRAVLLADAGVNTVDVATVVEPRRNVKRERAAAPSAGLKLPTTAAEQQHRRPPQPGRLTASSTNDDDDDEGEEEADLLLLRGKASDDHDQCHRRQRQPRRGADSSGVSPPPNASPSSGGAGYGTMPPPVGSIGAALDDLLGNLDGGGAVAEPGNMGSGGDKANAMLPPDPTGRHSSESSRPYLDPVSPSRDEAVPMRRALTKASVATRGGGGGGGGTTPSTRGGALLAAGGPGALPSRHPGSGTGGASRLLLYDESPGGCETELLAAPPPARGPSGKSKAAAGVQHHSAVAAAAESQAVYMGLNDMDVIGGNRE